MVNTVALMHLGGSRKRCTKAVTVFETITHLLSIKSSNVDDFHVSVAINICVVSRQNQQ